MPIDVRLASIKPQWVVSRRTHASVARDVETVDLLLNELVATARACGALSAKREFVFYYNPFRRRRGYDLEVCVPLNSRRARCVPGAKRLPGGTAATLTHRGPWEDLHPVYVSLYAWIREYDYDTVGAPRETYLVDERDTDDPLEYLTRVDWLVELAE
jgi:effector-binding domain-containing protein